MTTQTKLIRAASVVALTVAAGLWPLAVQAQSVPVTTTYKRDAAGRITGIIQGDPDGTGVLKSRATKNTYDANGRLQRVDQGVVNGPADAQWSSFSSVAYDIYTYDAGGNRLTAASYDGATSATLSLTQTRYDAESRPLCTAVRMNLATTQNSDACLLTAVQGSYGTDRIVKNSYNAGGQLTMVQQAYGTTVQRTYATYSYTANGLKRSETDANSNMYLLSYDGFDRLIQLTYPSTTAGSRITNSNDYEWFTYDANDNRKSYRRRNGLWVYYNYDALNRVTVEDQPAINHPITGAALLTATEKDIYFSYDLMGHILAKRLETASGIGVSYSYDGLGRMTSSTDMNNRTVAYQYNIFSNRTRLTYPDGNYVDTATLDDLGRIKAATWNGTTSIYGLAYTSRGMRKKLQFSTAVPAGEYTDQPCVTATKAVCYAYDAMGRLSSYSFDLNNTGADVAWSFTGRNPAGQVTRWNVNNDVYNYKEKATSIVQASFDGLNRDAGIASIGGGYDVNGNLANEGNTAGKRIMAYDAMNRLLTVAAGNAPTVNLLKMQYDPEGRLARYSTNNGSSWTEFLYDGVNLIGEYNHPSGTAHTSDTLTQRYVFGPGVDEPLAWYKNATLASPYFLMANYQGSIFGYMAADGSLVSWYKYGPYGEPTDSGDSVNWAPATTAPRFRYTGQYALPEARLYYYKARVYDPMYGRFMQTDPIGSRDDLNLYGYVKDDPINMTDPSGLVTATLNYDVAIGASPQDAWVGGVALAVSYEGGAWDMGIITTQTHDGQGGGLALKASVQGGLTGGDIKSQDGYKLKFSADVPDFGVSYETKTDANGNPIGTEAKGTSKVGGQKQNWGGNLKVGVSAGGGVTSSVVKVRSYTVSDVKRAVDTMQKSVRKTIEPVQNVIDKVKSWFPGF